ncbi:unnamed protein product, partial [Iphiclides podalirius]
MEQLLVILLCGLAASKAPPPLDGCMTIEGTRVCLVTKPDGTPQFSLTKIPPPLDGCMTIEGHRVCLINKPGGSTEYSVTKEGTIRVPPAPDGCMYIEGHRVCLIDKPGGSAKFSVTKIPPPLDGCMMIEGHRVCLINRPDGSAKYSITKEGTTRINYRGSKKLLHKKEMQVPSPLDGCMNIEGSRVCIVNKPDGSTEYSIAKAGEIRHRASKKHTISKLEKKGMQAPSGHKKNTITKVHKKKMQGKPRGLHKNTIRKLHEKRMQYPWVTWQYVRTNENRSRFEQPERQDEFENVKYLRLETDEYILSFREGDL